MQEQQLKFYTTSPTIKGPPYSQKMIQVFSLEIAKRETIKHWVKRFISATTLIVFFAKPLR